MILSRPLPTDVQDLGYFRIDPDSPRHRYLHRWLVGGWSDSTQSNVVQRRFYTRWRMESYLRRLKLRCEAKPDKHVSPGHWLLAFLNLGGWSKIHYCEPPLLSRLVRR